MQLHDQNQKKIVEAGETNAIDITAPPRRPSKMRYANGKMMDYLNENEKSITAGGLKYRTRFSFRRTRQEQHTTNN